MYTCRECERPVNQAAELCPYCGADLTLEALGEGDGHPEQRGRVILRRVTLWGLMVAALWGVLWIVLPESRPFGGSAVKEAENQARATLDEVNRALHAYAEAQGGFPASLELLPPANIPAVRSAARKALAMGYELEYTPGPAEQDGTVRTFRLQAKAGHYGYANFFLDQTGAIRTSR